MYLGIDPGDTTGYALFDAQGEFVEKAQVKEADLDPWLDEYIRPDRVKCVIIEDYKVFHHKAKAHIGKRPKTSEKIGKVELLCNMRGIHLHRVNSQQKYTGYKWAGLEQPSNHSISHMWDAYAIVVFYLTNIAKVLKPGQLLQLRPLNVRKPPQEPVA